IDTGAADVKRDLLRSGRSARTNDDVATAAVAAASTGTITAVSTAGVIAATVVVTFTDGDIRVTTALITFGRHYHVIVITQIQTFACPEVGMVSKGDGARNISKCFFG